MEINFLKNQKLYQSLFTESVNPLVLTDASDKIVDANEAYCSLLGYTRKEIMSLTLKDLIPKEKIPSEGSITLNDIKHHANNIFDTEDLHKNGSRIPVEVTIFPLNSYNGPLFFSVVRDIRKRKAVEKKLILSEKLYRSVFENAGVSLWEEDFSETKKILNNLTKKGVKDLGTYFRENPDFIFSVIDTIKVLNINNETLRLLEAETTEQITGSLDLLLNKNGIKVMEAEFLALANGSKEFTGEMETLTLTDKKITVLFKIKFSTEKEKLKHTIVSMMDITQLKKAEQSLVEALTEKEILMKELYHRTKNNMQMIESFLSLETAYSNNKEVIEVFEDMKNRIHSMSAVHEKLYQSESLDSISLDEYINDIVQTLQTSYNLSRDAVVIENHLEPVIIPLGKAVPCGIVLNEIITNIFKYAFPGNRKGKVIITLTKTEDGVVHLTFSDNGIGVHEDFNFREHGNLGMKLIFSITEDQLNGKIEQETTDGITWKLSFPV